LKKNEVDEKRAERDKDTIRVEELNYKVSLAAISERKKKS
jgi:hypothetical protein